MNDRALEPVLLTSIEGGVATLIVGR